MFWCNDVDNFFDKQFHRWKAALSLLLKAFASFCRCAFSDDLFWWCIIVIVTTSTTTTIICVQSCSRPLGPFRSHNLSILYFFVLFSDTLFLISSLVPPRALHPSSQISSYCTSCIGILSHLFYFEAPKYYVHSIIVFSLPGFLWFLSLLTYILLLCHF